MTRLRAFAGAALFAAALAWPHGAVAQGTLAVRVHASGFSAPVAIVQDPTDRQVQFVVEQGGRIRAVRGGVVQATDFLDLRGPELGGGGERGLLGMALAPNYAVSGRFFINYTNAAGHTVIARYRRSANPLVADPSTRFALTLGPSREPFIPQPFANHNGGHLAFGPDGHLYIGLGDGGSGDDPGHRAQSPGDLLGKMLRIDVNVADSDPFGYTVPPTNPFVSGGPQGTRPEIWAFGLRNPWRYSFDSLTGALVMGDVGQGQREEINYEPRGAGGRNYGWRNREGTLTLTHLSQPPPAYVPLTDPIHEYGRALGASVTGGVVYRGRALGAAFQGRYFFADFIFSRVWSIGLSINSITGEATASAATDHTADLGSLANVSSFGVDADQEIFIISYGRGEILRLVRTPTPPTKPTGLRIIKK